MTYTPEQIARARELAIKHVGRAQYDFMKGALVAMTDTIERAAFHMERLRGVNCSEARELRNGEHLK